MKRTLLWLVAVALAVSALMMIVHFYRAHSAGKLDVSPRVREQIEKAKRR